KHNASQFADFIKENETDFIRFKTQLLLKEAGNDPIKRSSLINDIIRSIAIIPDNIIRSVYIRECSAMMEIEEQVLLNETNKIRLSQEERKQPQPPVTQSQPAIVPLPEEQVATAKEEVAHADNGFISPSPIRSPFEVYESALVRYIVRYGELILFDYFDEELQQQIVMKVAEYIYFDLKRDDIDIKTPLFKQILEEAALKCKEEGFIANRFFLAHPDAQISQLAANLLSEKYQLSKYHTKYKDLETEESKLPQLIPHEIFALKNAYIQYRIKEILVKMKETQHTGDMEKALELQRQFLKLNEMKDVLSKQLGERIVLKM
ncbi:MAG: DNA primase, partial [Tannerellaceae bacterium]|nr:DNA primase [Tannerellaceae bacterium]